MTQQNDMETTEELIEVEESKETLEETRMRRREERRLRNDLIIGYSMITVFALAAAIGYSILWDVPSKLIHKEESKITDSKWFMKVKQDPMYIPVTTVNNSEN